LSSVRTVWLLHGFWIEWLNLLRLYTSLVTTSNTALFLIYTLYSSPLHTLYGSQSSLVVSWQRIYNSLIVTTAYIKSPHHSWTYKSHAKSSLHRLTFNLSHFRLLSQGTSSILFSRPWILVIQPQVGPNSKHRFHRYSSTIPQFLLACSLPREPVHRVVACNKCLLWLRYSGFQASCHIIVVLFLFLSLSLFKLILSFTIFPWAVITAVALRCLFWGGVGLKPPLGPFFRSPRFRFLRSLCSSPLGPYKSQHWGHTLAYCAFPGWYMRVIVE
jgi:hypothetical protein